MATRRSLQPREHAEQHQADGQRSLASVLVAERAGGEQQAREHDDVRVEDPLDVGAARAEVAHDRGQRDVEDRVVDRDDEQRHAEDGERVPAALVGLLRAEQRGRSLDLGAVPRRATVNYLVKRAIEAANTASARVGSMASRDPEATKARILAAARREFSAKGISGARVDAIAARAKVNKRMLYYYFESKEGLFREILRRRLHERTRRCAPAPSPIPAGSPKGRPTRRRHRVHAPPHVGGARDRPRPPGQPSMRRDSTPAGSTRSRRSSAPEGSQPTSTPPSWC